MSDEKALERLVGLAKICPEVAEARLVTLPGNVPPWTRTGLRVSAGDSVTLLGGGRVVIAEALDLWYPPSLALWGRVSPGGEIFNPPRDTVTHAAEHDGELELAVYNGEWATRRGELATPVDAYAGATGALHAALIRWRADGRSGLRALERLAPGDPRLSAELRRLETPRRPPRGWKHLWFLGDSEIFAEQAGSDGPVIDVQTHNDVGIVRTPVDAPLRADTTLRWRWCVSELPARVAEDQAHVHDYLSLALEFDNGLDLTWYWSAALPPGSHYACPLPTWAARETHQVVRSGNEGLGAWHAEERPVREDYARAIGAPPERIVAVWLIAVSLFGHRRGAAQFADIRIRNADQELRVFPRG